MILLLIKLSYLSISPRSPKIVGSVKVMLPGTICNDDFKRNNVVPYW